MSERSLVTSPGRLYFTVGLPQSGKSTLCNLWAKRLDETSNRQHLELLMSRDFIVGNRPFHNRAVVGGDDFRHALYGREYQIEAEATVFAMMDVAIRALLRRGFDVLVDETSTTEATLLRYYRIDLGAQPIFIDTPVSVCKDRAIAAGREYLLGPIDRMAKQLEELRSNWDETVSRLKGQLQQRKTQDVAV